MICKRGSSSWTGSPPTTERAVGKAGAAATMTLTVVDTTARAAAALAVPYAGLGEAVSTRPPGVPKAV